MHLGRALGLTEGLLEVSLFLYQKFPNRGCLSPKPNGGFGKQTVERKERKGRRKSEGPISFSTFATLETTSKAAL